MTRRIPPELHRNAIRTSTGSDHALTRRRLRRDDIQHPFREVSAFDLDLSSTRDRCRAFLPVMESGQVFSHTTALALHRIPLPPQEPVLHISVRFPRTPPRRPGVVGHSLTSSPASLLDAMPVAPAVVAWAQSGVLLSREDAVAAADAVLLHRHASPDLLAATASGWQGRPGAARLRWAASRARLGVRSRPESHLRLLLVRSRLPEPVVAHPVRVAGGLILHPDLAYPGHRLAIEYEGDGHRGRTSWELDIERRELLAEANWRTIRVTTTQLYGDPLRVVARVRRHLSA
jgi:very-short-patch-repair endonuclease